MDEKTKKRIKNLLKKVQRGREYSQPFHPAKLFELSQDLVAGQAWMISHLLESETAYRQKVIEFKNDETVQEGKIIRVSNAEAENKAKTTQEYQDYRFLKYVDNIIEQQIMLIKKFADKLEKERDNI